MSTRANLNTFAVCGMALLFAVPAAASTFIFDDFSSGDDGQWEHVDQTADVCGKPADYDASGHDYRLQSQCAIDDESNAFIGARWQGGPDTYVADATVRVKASHLNAGSNAFISLRSWGSENIGMWGYRFRVSGGGSMMSISRVWEHGSDTVLASLISVRQFFDTGEDIYIEASAVGPRLALKIWRVGDKAPDNPQLVTHDQVFFDAGSLVIGVDHDGPASLMGATFDDVVYTTEVPGDANHDGAADYADIMLMLANWGACGSCAADVTGDGFVDFADVMLVLANWS